MTDSYDLVVIGSGPAGQSAAELSAFLGRSTLIIERGLPGGTVTTAGGVPTKTLRELARSMHRSSRMDVSSEVLPELRTRTLAVCRSLQSTTATQIEQRGIDFVRGAARLTGDGTVTVDPPDGDARTIAARHIVLAPGSSPVRPSGIPFSDPDVYDSDEIFALQTLPPSMAIVGGGPVGVEFASVLNALGVAVTLIEHGDRILTTMDGELAMRMTAELERSGVVLRCGEGVANVSRHGRLTMTLSSGLTLDTHAVLFATGRRANTDGLGLDRAGIALDSRGRIVVDRYFMTTCAEVYAVGDAVAPTLASVAMQQGRAAVCHALGLAFGVPVDRQASAAVYGLPEVAAVGVHEEEVRASGVAYVVGRAALEGTARGTIAGTHGLLKLIVRADDRRLLGVHCIGEIASELVAMGHAALHMGAAVDLFLTLALNTPTYTAAYRDAAIDAVMQLSQLARPGLSSSDAVSVDATLEERRPR